MTDNRLAAFAQDDWRITRKLSLSLGLRYEWFPQWNMAKDLNTNFGLRTGKIIISDTTRDWVTANLGLAKGVLPGNYEYRPRDQVQPASTSIDLSPRIGFAYPLLGEGFGIFFLNAARYNALEVSLRQREWRGLSVTTALTVSNSIGDNGSIDPYNFSYAHGRLSNDYGDNWVSSAIYNVPTPRNWYRLTRQILGGWQTATIGQLQGGAPFSVNSSQTMNQADLAVQKSFQVYERARSTFRAESSNVLNQVNLGGPSATVGVAAFGTIRGLNGDPRHMQVSLRADF